jgi:hypothetical protein
MAAKRKSPLKEMIDQSLQELQNSGFESDPLLNDGQVLTGPERFAKGQRQKDEVLIDLQLADISGKEGYFLKLKKEMRPDEWMLMKTIETEWRQWPDMESAVGNIVREHTKMAPQKWGSGRYRIEYACKGGMRGKGYPPVDFSINAEEEFLNLSGQGTMNNAPVADATTQVTSQLDMLARLMDVMKGVQPASIDPATIQKQNAEAFQQGLAIKANEGNASAQMMTAMMTGLMGMMTAMATNNNRPVEKPTDDALPRLLETLKTFGVLGEKVPVEKPKTTIEFLAELKLLGMDVLKKDDPMEQITKLKQLANIAGEFMGMGGQGEKPGILEKIVDMVGPAIPGMLNDMKETASNAVRVQELAGENMRIAQGRQQIQAPQQPVQQNAPVAPMPTQAGVNPQIAAFFNGLYEAVKTNNRMFYPVVYTSLLQDAQGQALVQGLVASTQSAKEVIELLQAHGDARYKESEFVMKYLVSYTNGFIMWVRQMAAPQQNGYGEQSNGSMPTPTTQQTQEANFDVECPTCHAVYTYATEQEFNNEASKSCGESGCMGQLQPVTKV